MAILRLRRSPASSALPYSKPERPARAAAFRAAVFVGTQVIAAREAPPAEVPGVHFGVAPAGPPAWECDRGDDKECQNGPETVRQVRAVPQPQDGRDDHQR